MFVPMSLLPGSCLGGQDSIDQSTQHAHNFVPLR